MKIVSVFFFVLAFINASVFIKGSDFSGYIFEENHFVLMTIDNQSKRYTPTKEDIFFIEAVIKKNIALKNKLLVNQTNGYPTIHKKLSRYVRQYVGFINESNEKVIWVNFIWKGRYTEKQLAENIINVHDGGSYYWSAQVNLTTKEISEISINGIG